MKTEANMASYLGHGGLHCLRPGFIMAFSPTPAGKDSAETIGRREVKYRTV
jgi:hypothetical protein